ncbi:MAG: hypothetical protein JWR09_2954 [Mucilaginibacter sp.]|nr:hypothetical protein [Mucilaginibacter sp.]
MKLFSFILVSLLLFCTIAKAQNAPAELHKIVAKDLTSKIGIIPINDDQKTIEQFTTESKNSYHKVGTVFYTFKLSSTNGNDILKIHTKAALSQSQSQQQPVASEENKFDVGVSYACTDPRHTLRHTAPTLPAMKLLQNEFHCSGIQMIVHQLN